MNNSIKVSVAGIIDGTVFGSSQLPLVDLESRNIRFYDPRPKAFTLDRTSAAIFAQARAMGKSNRKGPGIRRIRQLMISFHPSQSTGIFVTSSVQHVADVLCRLKRATNVFALLNLVHPRSPCLASALKESITLPIPEQVM